MQTIPIGLNMAKFKIYHETEGTFSDSIIDNVSGDLVLLPGMAVLSLEKQVGEAQHVIQTPPTSFGLGEFGGTSTRDFPPSDEGGWIFPDGATKPTTLAELVKQAKENWGWSVDNDLWRALGLR